MEILRVLTLNLWGEQPPLERRMELVASGLHAMRPDVIALQEVREVPETMPNQAATLAQALGYQYAFAVATPWGGGSEGLALLSALPIVRSEWRELPHASTQERRIVLGAALATDQGELGVFTTHLNWRMVDGIKRESQVSAVDAFVSAWPSSLPKVVMGDFNATPMHDEIRFLRGQHTLEGRRTVYQDAWERYHPGDPGYTWSARNPYTQRMRFVEADRRLDYVFVSPVTRDGRGFIHSCHLVFDQAAADGTFASDHFGLYAEIQIAPLP